MPEAIPGASNYVYSLKPYRFLWANAREEVLDLLNGVGHPIKP